MNNQQLLFIQALLQGVKEGRRQKETIKIGVKEKHKGIKFDFEICTNCNNFLTYRTIDSNSNVSLYNTWTEPEEIKNTFRMLSLI